MRKQKYAQACILMHIPIYKHWRHRHRWREGYVDLCFIHTYHSTTLFFQLMIFSKINVNVLLHLNCIFIALDCPMWNYFMHIHLLCLQKRKWKLFKQKSNSLYILFSIPLFFTLCLYCIFTVHTVENQIFVSYNL